MVVKNALMTVGVRLTLVAAGLATTIVTARWLGPAGRGDYFFVIAMSAIAAQIVHLGLHASNAFYVAKDASLFGALAVNSYWISVILGSVAAAVSIAVVVFLGESRHNLDVLYWALLLTPTSLAALFISNLYVGVGRITEYNVVQLATTILPFALICGVALYSRAAPAFLAAAAIAGFVNQLFLAAYALRGRAIRWRFDIKLFRACLPFAIRAYLINALCTLALKVPALMFTASSLKSELGYFSIASQVFDTVSVVPASIAAILFPVLMKLDVDRWRATCRYMGILMVLASSFALILALFANTFVEVLFGARFAGAAAPLRIILPGAVFVSGTAVLSQYLATHGMPRTAAFAWLAASAICIGFGPEVVRVHGAAGAALVLSGATGVAWFILLILSVQVSRRSIEVI